jgi:hypothetical protein
MNIKQNCSCNFYIISVVILLITFIIYGDGNRLLSPSLCNFHPSSCFFLSDLCSESKGKVVHLVKLSMTSWRRMGEGRYNSTHCYSELFMEVSGHRTLEERAIGTHWTGGLVGHSEHSDEENNLSVIWTSNPDSSVSQPVL